MMIGTVEVAKSVWPSDGGRREEILVRPSE